MTILVVAFHSFANALKNNRYSSVMHLTVINSAAGRQNNPTYRFPPLWSFFFIWPNSPQWVRASSFTRFLDHTQRRTTVSRTPLDEWSARRRDLYLTTHNNHNRETSMPPVGFKPTIPESAWPQTYTLDSAATGTDLWPQLVIKN